MTPSGADDALSRLGEDTLVERFTRNLPLSTEVVLGAGDDCAVVRPIGRGWLQLLKTDCIVEDVHFIADTSPRKVGWKAMARAVSDIAAMGGEPQHALVTLVLPKDLPLRRATGIYDGLKKCAAAFGVSIVGGETSSGPKTIISVALTGRVKAKQCLRRSGAKVGDAILVTGKLGGSFGGHHLDFKPRVAEGQWLAANVRVHAMMDLSDGLAKDLPRMAAASGLAGFEVWDERLPLRRGCTVAQAWGDGEDYELLFCIAPREVNKLMASWKKDFPRVKLTHVGHFTGEKTLRKVGAELGGWDHFRP